MIVGVPKETYPGERRVALIPPVVAALVRAGWEVRVESLAGEAAGFPDAAFAERGAMVVSRDEVFAADLLLFVRTAGANPQAGRADWQRFRPGQAVVGLCDPLGNPQATAEAAAGGATLFALELLPRITRAQSMDVLSSQATVAGYRAVLIAALALPKMFPMMITAAGTLNPAKVLIIGAGVAGLQAIATAKRLGAAVSAYDVRPAVKEQVQSLGAKFVEMPLETAQAETAGGYAQAMNEEFYRKQRVLMDRIVAESDLVITTAAVPGKRAPVLVTAEMVAHMAPGSIVVDLAAERGGNCELTRAGESVRVGGVTVLGPVDLPAEVPHHASQLYAKNIAAFCQHLLPDGKLRADDDEIVRETLVAREGRVVHPRLLELLSPPGGQAASS